MSWAAVDDRFFAHPKVQRLLRRYPCEGMTALGLWLLTLSWGRSFAAETGQMPLDAACDAFSTDEVFVRQLAGRLVEVGLCDGSLDDTGLLTGEAIAIHDWDDWQRPQQVRAGQARAAKASREHGRFAPADQRAGDAGGAGDSAGDQPAIPIPSHPIPSTPVRAGAVLKDVTEFRRKVAAPK